MLSLLSFYSRAPSFIAGALRAPWSKDNYGRTRFLVMTILHNPELPLDDAEHRCGPGFPPAMIHSCHSDDKDSAVLQVLGVMVQGGFDLAQRNVIQGLAKKDDVELLRGFVAE